MQLATRMLTTGITQLQNDIKTAMQAYAVADSELPSIDAQISNVITQLNALTRQLEVLEKKLLEQARKDVEEEHEALFFVRMLAGIAQMFPIGQPALGAIGTGLNIISNIDTSKPLDTFTQLGDLLEKYKGSDLDASADKYPGFTFGQGLILDSTPGCLLIFPAWLEHLVHPFYGKGERISISAKVTMKHVATKAPAVPFLSSRNLVEIR